MLTNLSVLTRLTLFSLILLVANGCSKKTGSTAADASPSGGPATNPATAGSSGSTASGSSSGTSSTSPASSVPAGTAVGALALDLTGAFGFATVQQPGVSLSLGLTDNPSGFQKVSADGSLTQAFKSGTASISNFYVAPGGAGIYLVFSDAVQFLETNSASGTQTVSNCLLGRADTTTGAVNCVDDQMSSINWAIGATNTTSAPIQIDGSGTIYYSGTVQTGETSSTVLRKNDGNGNYTDLINDEINLGSFHVIENGSVFVTGSTASNGNLWFREITPTGSITGITTDTSGTWMQKWPDGNYYVSSLCGPLPEISQINTSTATISTSIWLAPQDTSTIFCRLPATNILGAIGTLAPSSTAVATNGKVYGVTVGTSGKPILIQMYPTAQQVNLSAITSVTIMKSFLSTLIISGTDTQGNPHLSMYDSSSSTETDLLPTSQVEIYHLTYNSSQNLLLFDGLRFSDNVVVIGQVDFGNSNAVTMTPTSGGIKLSDFQSL